MQGQLGMVSMLIEQYNADMNIRDALVNLLLPHKMPPEMPRGGCGQGANDSFNSGIHATACSLQEWQGGCC